MNSAFAPAPSLRLHTAPPTRLGLAARRPRHCRAASPRAVVVISPSGIPSLLPLEETPEPHAPFAGYFADEVMTFMNTELRNHLATYVCKFGHKITDMGLIDAISIGEIADNGMFIDIVTCDHDGCVCVREQVPWLDGALVHSAEEVPDQLRKLSLECGLPTDVF